VLQGLAIGAPIAGGIVQGRAAQAGASAEAAAAQYNARLAELEGAERAGYVRRQGRSALTSEETRIRAAGGAISGTTADYLARRAYEIERAAVDEEIAARNTARLERARASSVRQAGKVSARTALLGGATQGAQFGLQFWRP
jgi:hypothetical protein